MKFFGWLARLRHADQNPHFGDGRRPKPEMPCIVTGTRELRICRSLLSTLSREAPRGQAPEGSWHDLPDGTFGLVPGMIARGHPAFQMHFTGRTPTISTGRVPDREDVLLDGAATATHI